VETNERRPGEGGVQDDDHGGIKGSLAVAAGIRRRRDAAWRLPPLASAYRDPIDMLAGLPIPARPQPCRGMFGSGGKWQPCCRRDVT
jgi:hypothetical protein